MRFDGAEIQRLCALAEQKYDELELERLPPALRRNSLDYYYLSVWPGLEQLRPLAPEHLPRRSEPVRYAYVHFPFCSGLCDFCSYFVKVSTDPQHDERLDRYIDALLLEVDLHQAQSTELAIEVLFLGGGTPSLMSPSRLERLLGGLRARGALADRIIGTVEAHPELFADEGRAVAFLDVLEEHGVDRVSVGLQTDDDELLSDTNRRHDAALGARAVELLEGRSMKMNLDLMYGLPGQALAGWVRSISAALALQPDSLSTYFMFVDPWTQLWRDVQRGTVSTQSHREVQTKHIATQLALEPEGYWELPNDFWAIPEGDPRSWQVASLPSAANSLGLGAGAYGYYEGLQYFNHFDLVDYHRSLQDRHLPVWRGLSLSGAQQRCRDVMFSLKNDPYLDLALFEDVHHASVHESFGEVMDRLDGLDLVRIDGSALRLTRKGRLMVEEIACQFEPPGHHDVRVEGDKRIARHNFAPTYSRTVPVG